MTDIYVNTGTTFQQPYNARQPAIGRVPANSQLTARQPVNAQTPFTYQNRSPFTYRNPVSGQQPYIANAQQSYPYIANAQQPYIANSQTPFTYQNRQPAITQQPYIANAQQPYIANGQNPFTYQNRYPADAQTPYIANARQPATYQARSPFTYRHPYIANAQQPYIANARQPSIANAQTPFIYQATYQAQGNYRVPFTYQVSVPAIGTAPAIGTQPGGNLEVNETISNNTTGNDLGMMRSFINAPPFVLASMAIGIKLHFTGGIIGDFVTMSAKFTTGSYNNRSLPSWASSWGTYYVMWYLGLPFGGPETFQLEVSSSSTIDGDIVIEGPLGSHSDTLAITSISVNNDTTYYIDGTSTNYTWPTSSTYGTYGYQINTSIESETFLNNNNSIKTAYFTHGHTFRMNRSGFPTYTGPSVDTDNHIEIQTSSDTDLKSPYGPPPI